MRQVQFPKSCYKRVERLKDSLQESAVSRGRALDMTLELWTSHDHAKLELILNEYFKNIFCESTPAYSLMGEGLHCYVVGQTSGIDLLQEDTAFLERLVENQIYPLKVGVDVSPDANEAWLQGTYYLNMGDAKLAARYYDLALSQECREVDSAHLFLSAGTAHYHSGNFARAEELLLHALELSERKSFIIDSLQHLGAVRHALGDHRGALVYLERALQLDPESGIKLFNVANAHCLMGDYSKTIRYLSQALGTEQSFTVLEHVLQDPDFGEVRRSSCFRELLESVAD